MAAEINRPDSIAVIITVQPTSVLTIIQVRLLGQYAMIIVSLAYILGITLGMQVEAANRAIAINSGIHKG